MNCPNCGENNPENATYCGKCGQALPGQVPSQPEQPSPVGGIALPAQPSLPPDAILPATLKQLLNHTLGVYQHTAGPVLRIVLPSQIPFLLASITQDQPIILTLTLIGIFTSLLASAAVTFAVVQFYLGHKVAAAGSYVGAMNNGVSLLMNGIVFGCALLAGLVLSVFVIGIPILLFVAVAWFFYVQVVTIEGAGSLVALGRSWTLVRGSWWRTFGVGIAYITVVLAAVSVFYLLGWLLTLVNNVAGNLLITLGGAFVAPIGYIGATLVYFDLRARKEGLTLSQLAQEVGGVRSPQGPPTEGPGRPL